MSSVDDVMGASGDRQQEGGFFTVHEEATRPRVNAEAMPEMMQLNNTQAHKSMQAKMKSEEEMDH